MRGRESDMLDVADWLRGLGLEQYIETFADNAIDAEVLHDLTDEDLAGLGVLLGHRKKMLKSLSQAQAPAAAPQEAENRTLTVMFCDLVGSTALASAMDPEDLRELLRHYQTACTSVVTAYDGFVAQYLGDGIMVYFGYPRAQEDAAERAIDAALDIVEAVRGLNETTPLQVRIGITTGTALVGDLIGQGSAAQMFAASGQTPSIAARIQGLAEPQQILIGDATRRRVGGLFDCCDLGEFALKGIPEPVRVWQVLADRKGASRFDAVRSQNLAPLVGRRDETTTLDQLWEQAKAGKGRVVLVTGEAGIGKSRMVEALRQRLNQEQRGELRWQCSPRHLNSPLHPFIQQLHMAADFAAGTSDNGRWNRLMALLSRSHQHDTLDLPLLAQLLSINSANLQALVGLPAIRQRALTVEALLRYVGGTLMGKPGLLIFEDAQWIDPSSLEVLNRMVGDIESWPVLLVVTARPEFQAPWAGVTTLSPGRIAPVDAKALMAGVTGYRALPTEVEETIIKKADGNPLFIEELTKLVLESGLLQLAGDEYVLTGSLQSLSVPETLQDSLMERLDRWPALKEVAQIGSVIGAEFSYRMISAVSDISERILQGSLQQLTSSEIVRASGEMPELDYVFKHALLQDAAYGSLLRSKRQKLHRRVADTLSNLFPEIVAAAPQVMAHHLAEAGAWGEAAAFYLQAGRRALQRSANVEAGRHLTEGIALLTRLPEDAERRKLEFNLNLALGQASFVTHGPAATATIGAFAVAQKLVDQAGEPAQRFDVLYGIFGGYVLTCRLDLARAPAERVLEIANSAEDDGYRALARRMLGVVKVHGGDLIGGRQEMEQALALYQAERDGEKAFRYGSDIGVAAKLYIAGIDCQAGEHDRAMQLAEAALDDAMRLGHAQTIGQAYAYNTYARFYFGEAEEADRLAQEGLIYCEKSKVSTFLFIFRMVRAWVASRHGEADKQAGIIRQMITLYRDQGGILGLPLYRTFLAETLLAAGLKEEAFAEMTLALEDIGSFGERYFEPMAWYVKGRCAPNPEEAERCFNQAIAVSRRTGARLYESKSLALTQ
jgi:class 3 adenylate cyclase/tetratricopeptide (TPR) repeat protein/energy-coupling factor transporter ATP-binding protein EcfA2